MTRALAAGLIAVLLAGCATTQGHPRDDDAPETPREAAERCALPEERPERETPLPDFEPGMEAYDPWHRFNRAVYRFNARFDDHIHYPVASTYRRVVPREMRGGIGNFFSNLGEIRNTANHLLQWRLRYSARSAARFLVNSTFGLAGLFDVAGPAMELAHTPTGFGDTLGRWGIGPGPYLILPVLGPSTLRDGVGQAADLGLNRVVDVAGIYGGRAALPVGTLYAVDTRARLAFRYYQTGSPFEYELVRFFYTRKRAIEVHGVRARTVPLLPANDDHAGCELGNDDPAPALP